MIKFLALLTLIKQEAHDLPLFIRHPASRKLEAPTKHETSFNSLVWDLRPRKQSDGTRGHEMLAKMTEIIASNAALNCPLYSDSVVEVETVDCRFDDELIAADPMLKT